MPELTPQQRQQLDSNIKAMLNNGATQDDVIKYASDFNAKFGQSVKKKEVSSEEISKRLVGGATKILSLLGYGVTGGSSVGQSGEKIKDEIKYKPSFDLQNYNRGFEMKTGMADIDLGSQSERAQEERNRQKYIRYRDIEENEIKPFEQDVFSGTVTKEKLQDFANKPFGKKVVRDIVREHLGTELSDGALDSEVVRSDVNAERLAGQLQDKFRAVGVENQNQALYDLDNKLYNEIEGLTAKKTYFDAQSEQMRTNEVPFKKIDTNNPTELGQLLRDIEAYGSDYTYSNSKGEIVTPKGISEKIRQKLFFIKANEPIHPEVEQVTDNIMVAVNKMDAGWKKNLGYGDAQKLELAQRDAQYIKEGLNYLKDADAGQYRNAINALKERNELGQLAYGNLIDIGKKMDNQKRFQYGERVIEDNRDFSTPEIRQERLSHILSEKIKEKGYRNRAAIPDKVILQTYNELPNELKDDESLQKIRLAEAAPAFGFLPIKQGEGIVKGGGVNAFFRGVAEPLKSIEETFNVLTQSPTETYLNSQKLSSGDQRLIDYKTGGVTNKLPSEKGVLLNDIVEGFGQFATQYLTSVGIGKLVQAPVLAAAKYGVPAPVLAGGEAALKSNINAYVGGFLSTAAQTYGQSYTDFLNKTGDPSKAKLMAFIDTMSQSALEIGVLPDVKLVEGFTNAWKMGNKNLAKDITNAIAKGATKSEVFEIAKNFVLKGGEVWGKEVLGEETAQNFANFLTESIFSPQTAEKRNILNESWETIKGATVSMAVPILLGGFTGAKTNRKSGATKNTLSILALNLNSTIESLNEGVKTGVISEQDRNKAVEIIEAHSKNIDNSPQEDANGNILSAKKRLEYAYQTTVKQFANNKAESLPDEIQKEPLKKEVTEAEDLQRKIVNGDNIDELEDEIQTEDLNKKDKTLLNDIHDLIKAEGGSVEGTNLQFFIDQSASATESTLTKFGEDITRELIGKSTTEQLQDGVRFAEQFNHENAKKILTDELSKRDINTQSGTTQSQQQGNIPEGGQEGSGIVGGEGLTVGEMIDKTGSYKGEKGSFYQDGQTVIFKVEGKNKEYELGNIDEVKNYPIKDFDISHEESVVSANDKGGITVRGEEYQNNYSNPLAAINHDKDGNVVSVNLETADGKKRTFRGGIAEDLAYQIHLKEISKNNETRNEFEQHLNEDATASKEMDNARLSETTKKDPTENNATVSREKIKPKPKVEKQSPTTEQPIQQNKETEQIIQERSDALDELERPEVSMEFVEQDEDAMVEKIMDEAKKRGKDGGKLVREHSRIQKQFEALQQLINCK